MSWNVKLFSFKLKPKYVLLNLVPAVVAVELGAADADLGAVDAPELPHVAADGAGPHGRRGGVGPRVRPDPEAIKKTRGKLSQVQAAPRKFNLNTKLCSVFNI